MTPTFPLQIQVFSSFSDVERFRHHWDRLAADNPFLGWDWQVTWWNSFRNNNLLETKELSIVVLTDSSGSLRGIAPFYVRGKLTGRSLRFLGDGKASSDYLRILTEKDAHTEVAQSLADWINSQDFVARFGSLDSIEMEGVKAGQIEIELLQRNLMVKGWKFHQQPIESAWSMSLEPDWKTLLSRMCTSQKRKAKKIVKQFEAGTLAGEVIDNPSEFDAAWQDFVRLHQKRRIELGEPGCFHDPVFEQFLNQATRKLLEIKCASLIFARYERMRISASLIFHNQETIFLYQSGIDSSFDQLDPGHSTNAFIIQWGAQQGYRYLDFLRGDEHYKKRWGAVPLSLYRARLISPKWSSRTKETIWQTARGIKNQSRSLLSILRKQGSSKSNANASELEGSNVSD